MQVTNPTQQRKRDKQQSRVKEEEEEEEQKEEQRHEGDDNTTPTTCVWLFCWAEPREEERSVRPVHHPQRHTIIAAIQNVPLCPDKPSLDTLKSSEYAGILRIRWQIVQVHSSTTSSSSSSTYMPPTTHTRTPALPRNF